MTAVISNDSTSFTIVADAIKALNSDPVEYAGITVISRIYHMI